MTDAFTLTDTPQGNDAADSAPGRKGRTLTVRCTTEQRAAMEKLAAEKGFSVGAFVRATCLGDPGPRSRRRPSLDREELGRMLGHIGHVGANINQIAKTLNMARDVLEYAEIARAAGDIAAIRAALMQALGRRSVTTRAVATNQPAALLGHQG